MQANRFSAAERVQLEELINDQMPLSFIAEVLSKHPTSVSREVKRNRTSLKEVKRSKFRRNPCAYAMECTITGLCKQKKQCTRRCVSCEYVYCDLSCESFVPWRCKALERWPYTCNRCLRQPTCSESRFVYQGKKAQQIHEMRASISRRGIDQDAASLSALDDLVTPLLKKGQSPFHIWSFHRYEMNISLATFYAYINAGLFKAGRMHLPRAVNFRPRKKETEPKAQRPCKKGRTYNDYLTYLHRGDRSEW